MNKSIKIKKEHLTEEINYFINEFLKSGLNKHSSEIEIEQFIEQLVLNNPGKKFEKNFGFCDANIYVDIEKEWNEEFCEKMCILHNVYYYLQEKIKDFNYKIVFPKQEEFEVRRNPNPPIEAYEYVPFNKMDIKHNNIGYYGNWNLIF